MTKITPSLQLFSLLNNFPVLQATNGYEHLGCLSTDIIHSENILAFLNSVWLILLTQPLNFYFELGSSGLISLT